METAGGTGSYPTAASHIAYGPLHFVGIEALTADRWADGYLVTLTPNFSYAGSARYGAHRRVRTRMVRPFSIRVCLFAEERATINKGTSCSAFLDFFKRDLARALDRQKVAWFNTR
jgi:hypothetical protein